MFFNATIFPTACISGRNIGCASDAAIYLAWTSIELSVCLGALRSKRSETHGGSKRSNITQTGMCSAAI